MSKNTLLKKLLGVFREPVIGIDSLDQKKFLNDIFDLKLDNKAADRILGNDRKDGPRKSLREKCEGAALEEKIRKVTTQLWNCSDIELCYALTNLIESTVFLTRAERNELLEIKKTKVLIRKLLYIGLGKRQLCFVPNSIEIGKFIGRTYDISRINEIINETGRCYLYGINGYGKTTLARYIGINDEYEDYIELQYNDELQASLMECDNFPIEMKFEDRLKQLEELEDNILLIVDNIKENYKSEKDHFSEYIERLSCKKIFVFDYRPQESSDAIYELKELSEDELLWIFKQNSSIADISLSEKKELIKTVQKNTLLVILCAKLLEEGRITTAELIKELKLCLFNVTDLTKFQISPYERAATYNSIIAEKLYNMFGMDIDEKKLLFAMWIFREYGIDKKVFLRLLNAVDANTLNTLIKKGWIEREVLDRISIHKIIADCIKNERKQNAEYSKEVDDSIYLHAKELIDSQGNEKLLLSYRWLYAFAELLIQSERKDSEYADFIILITRVCIGNFPGRETVELFLPKLKKCDKNWRTQFYIEHFENVMGLWERNFSELRQSEDRLINSLIPIISKTQNVKEWMDYFDCLASGFELIRSSYLEEIKIFKNEDAILEDMMEYYNYENRIMQELIARKNDIHTYVRVHSYWVNFVIYGLKCFKDDRLLDVCACLKFLSFYAEEYPDISMELHRAKARLALENNDYEDAKKEAQLAYEESCEIDNQSYELECLEEKIIIYQLCGVSDNELLEDNQRMKMLIEATGENISSRYYLPK